MGHAHHKDSWGLQQLSGILKASQHSFNPRKYIHTKMICVQRLGLLWEKKPPSCHIHCVNLDRETNAIVQSTTNSEKNCWWEKILHYMGRIQCAFVKKNPLTCSLKLLIKALREATEWWTKEPPSSLFSTFKSTGNNSDKIYEILDSVLFPCLQFLKKPLENKEHLANLS